MLNQQDQEQNQIKTNSLDDYILQDKIGSGGFGKVYRVKNKNTNKIYAAKISNESIKENKRIFQDISSEVQIISKLNHPSILKFINYSPYNFKQKPKPTIIIEYASNGSLKQLIEHDLINPGSCLLTDTIKLKIIYGIAHAMSYLHSHDILHRDLKPDNVLLDDFLHPKVADFGLSKSGNPNDHLIKTAVGTIKGTPFYIAPEIWKFGQYSKASDVYAFSIVVFEIMTLSSPSHSMNIFDLISAVSSCKRPTFDVFVPDSYKLLINRCWSQEPSERPTFSEIVCELRQDPSYITESVNVEEFKNYVNFIDGYETSFNENKVIIPTNIVGQTPFNFERVIMMFQNTTKKVIHFPYDYYKYLSKDNLYKVEEAETGNINQQFEVGRNLIEGRHDFPYDVRNGLKFLKASMKGGNKDAASYYVNMLIKGENILPDLSKARKIINKYLSESESTRLYYEGKVLNKEGQYSESAKLFKKSIELNNIDSMCEYAKLLLKGRVETNEQEESISIYKKAISLGHIGAMYELGFHMYKNCNEIKQQQQQKEEGISLIKKAADEGNVKAMHTYGTIIEKENDDRDSESMKYFKRAADEGYGKSINKYGVKLLKYLKSLPKQERKTEAVEYLIKACKRGFSESMLEYGMLLVNGDIGIPMNAKEGSKYVKNSALIGNVDAFGRYGRLLVEGNGVEIDIEEGIKYFKKGIEKGNSIAMHNYAHMLRFGHGVPVDYKEAIKYYKMAIDKGNTYSMNNYASMLNNGQGVPVDHKEAIKYFKMAIDKGNVLAMNNYASMLQHGQGVPVDYKEAIKYYKMAIDKGDSLAMTNYARMLQFGQGIPVNYKEAIKYFKMAIDKGDEYSPLHYADILRRGETVPVDIEGSVKYYKISIDKKNPFAMYRYASMLENGEGVEIDNEEANKYYKMSIENYENSHFKVQTFMMSGHAMILYEGKGVERNEEEAIKILRRAIAMNDEESLLRYGQILVNKNETDEMKKEGLELIRKSAERGFSESLYEYGRILEEGQIVEQNREESIKYYQKASERGNRKAQEALLNRKVFKNQEVSY